MNKKYNFRLFITGLSLCLFSLTMNAEEAKAGLEESSKSVTKIEETVLGMNVSGNKEAPNLLYIIPWKEIDTDANPPEIYRLMDEVYSTVDPDVFEKEVNFYGQLSENNGTKSREKKENR